LYNKPLASATLVAVPPGVKSAELDPKPNYKKKEEVLAKTCSSVIIYVCQVSLQTTVNISRKGQQ
jgi:hypothetical protein